MDHRAGVSTAAGTSTAARPESVSAEQAIFTSIRTPMGEGYRLVAMSPGITSEERAEITRRSPSHGSVCDPDAAAMAVSSYPLGTHRQCVAWTRYAGREHTARGGQRVHTHLAVLEPENFQAFAHDPFRVLAAMAAALGDVPNIKPTTCLPTLTLCVPGCQPDLPAVGPGQLEQACRVAAELHGHDVMLVVNAGPPCEVLRWTIAVLPQAHRAGLAVSANLQYAPSRQVRLTCLPGNTPELQRAIAGKEMQFFDAGVAGSWAGSSLAAWFDFLCDRNEQGRLAEFVALADQMVEPVDGRTLDRIVSICRDADRVDRADQADLEKLVARYADVQAANPVEARLMRQVLSAAVRRSAELQLAVQEQLPRGAAVVAQS